MMLATCGLLPLCGCASIAGSYVPLETADVSTAATTSQSEPSLADSSQVAASYPDSTVAGMASLDSPVTQTPESDPAAILDTVPSAKNTSATSKEVRHENPFAVMAREEAGAFAPDAVAAAHGAHEKKNTLYSGPPLDRKQPPLPAPVRKISYTTTFHEPTPRIPTGQPDCPVPCDVCLAECPIARAYPDEYICDGGDRAHPVHYFANEMQGLDTEDTVAEFQDHEGENHVQPSNRVCIYAPRFGTVEVISGPKMDIKIDSAINAANNAGINTISEDKGLDINVADSGSYNMAARRSASGVETAQNPQRSVRVQSAIQARKVDQGMEARETRGMGTLETTAIQELAIHVQEPITSNADTKIQQAASTSQATVTYSTYRLAATVGSEQRGRKGKLHLTKEASPLVAKPGDVITFTIRFRNIGDYNVHAVRIIDNLTPRLAYVSGSAQIEVGDENGGTLTAVPNKEGSETLIFELDEPLKGGQSGSITFEAKVR